MKIYSGSESEWKMNSEAYFVTISLPKMSQTESKWLILEQLFLKSKHFIVFREVAIVL